MGRKELPANRGMLFIFNPPRFVSFWMGNCFIPLDIVFVRQGRITSFAAKAKPCPTAQNCPSYPSKAEIDQVIELQAGQIQALNLKVKDPVTVSFLKEPALK
jgi:uncharacterized membrane protein (UPF0127 family)